MRVLQFIPSLSLKDGGTTTYMAELAPALGKLVELHVCTLGDLKDCVSLENTTIHTIEKSLRHLRTMRNQWLEVLKIVRPDVVHVNCCWLPQCALVQIWTQRYGIKVLGYKPNVALTPHGMLEPWIISRNYWTKKVPAIRLYQRSVVNDADVIVSTAEEERKHVIDLGWNKNVEMVPNGINTSAIQMKSEWRQPKNLLFMSRIHPKKGLEMLIEAMKKLQDDCLDTRTESSKAYRSLCLTIAGDGDPEYVERIKNETQSYENETRSYENKEERGKISFVGPVYGDEKWKLIREADIVVLPSYSENFGLIVAEAMASGTPVLTTTGTPWSCIKDNQCGWWVEPNVDEIYRALVDISQTSASKLEKMGRMSRQLIEEQFDVRIQAEALYKVYRNLCQ